MGVMGVPTTGLYVIAAVASSDCIVTVHWLALLLLILKTGWHHHLPVLQIRKQSELREESSFPQTMSSDFELGVKGPGPEKFPTQLPLLQKEGIETGEREGLDFPKSSSPTQWVFFACQFCGKYKRHQRASLPSSKVL